MTHTTTIAPNNERYVSLDGLRAYAIIGIVMMHVISNIPVKPSANILTTEIIPWFTNFTLLFMIVSGFSMSCGYFHRIADGLITPAEFYKKRYLRLLPFFGLMCLIELLYQPSLKTLYETYADLTMCFGLLPNVKISVIGVGWFIGVVMVYYMLFPFVVFLQKTPLRAIITFLMSLALVWVGAECTDDPTFGRHYIAYSMPLFLAGGIIYIYRRNIQLGGGKITSSVIALMAIALSTLPFIIHNQSIFTTLVVSLLTFCAWVIYAITTDNLLLNNRITRYLSNISLEIYLCHMVLYRAWEKFGIASHISDPDIAYAVTTIAVLAGSIIFSHIVKYYIIDAVIMKWRKKQSPS